MRSIPGSKVSLPLPFDSTCTVMLTTCTSQSGILKQSLAYGATPTVQTAVTDMDGAIADLQETASQLNEARALVATLEGKRDTRMATLRLKHDSVESAVNTASNNDPAAARAWTGETKTKAKPLPVGASSLPPERPTVRNVKSHSGMVEASCAKEQSVVGYAFQMGTDPAHPESWPPPVVTRGHTFKVGNLPIGQVVYFRVAVIRRGSIQSPWSPNLEIQVR